ncbi:MAG TPA: GNAT family N-acetyltransferase [Thermomicrobiales bacterium]|jgi:putative acetyltransferase
MAGRTATITVRARESTDLEAITTLMDCPGVVRGTLQLPLRSLDERREQYGVRVPGTHSVVAEIDGRVVGQLGLHVEQSPRRRYVGSIGMAVHDDFGGRGVGSALLAAILELADRWLALRRIELTVYTDNAAAIGLYEKFGFVREGHLRDYAFRDGDYVDAFFMARVLP